MVSRAFTSKYRGISNRLVNECGVTEAFDPKIGILPTTSTVKFLAIWDTGATNSVITQNVVNALNLKPIGMTKVHGVGGLQNAEVYIVGIILLNNVRFHTVRVTKGCLPAGGGDLLIGMDIIATGDFAVTNTGGTTQFSFRHPSQHHVDYAQYINAENKKNKNKNKGQNLKGKNRHRW